MQRSALCSLPSACPKRHHARDGCSFSLLVFNGVGNCRAGSGFRGGGDLADGNPHATGSLDAGAWWAPDVGADTEPGGATSLQVAEQTPGAKPMDERAKPEIGSDDLNPGAQIPSWIPRGARPVTSRSDPLPSGTVADPLELAADLASVARTCVEAAKAAAAAEQAVAVWVDNNPKAAAAIAAWAEERGPQLPSVGEVEETDRSTFLVEAEQLAMTVADAQAWTGLDSADITDWLLLVGDRDRADAELLGCKQAQQVAESDVLAAIAVNSKALDGRESKTSAAGPQMLALTSSCTSKPAAVDGQIAGFIPALSFTVTSGQAVEVSTSNLTLAGAPWASSTPDSVIYLLRCAAGDCTQGSIIAVNDDGNSATTANGTYPWDNLDSRIQIASGSLAAGTYYVLVLKYGLNGEGRGRIQARVGPTLGSLTTVVDVTRTFAGSLPDGRLLVRELKANDVVAVGRDDNTGTLLASAPANYPFLQANPEYADSTLWMFSNATANCTSNCGNFQQNQDAFQFFSGANPSRVALSRAIVAGAASTTPLVAIGTANERLSGNEGAINVRLLHVRKHSTQGGGWTCNEQVDLDGDGLPWDLEDDVGSCDRVLASVNPITDTGSDIGILGRNCREYAGFINQQVNQWQTGSACPTTFLSSLPSNPSSHTNCWDPKDSDNDGLRDDQEVFAAVGAFATQPQPPLYEAAASGSIITISTAYSTCPSGWCTGVDLSAYYDPSPNSYDVFIHNSAFECTGPQCTSDKFQSGIRASQELIDEDQQMLLDSWTESARDCWDSTATCSGGGSADRPYMVRMHAMNGSRLTMVDSLGLGETSWGGLYAARRFGYSPTNWPLPWKLLMLSRFTISGTREGGQSDYGRVASWGNDEAGRVNTSFIHEVGHTLSLHHSHNDRGLPAPNPTSIGGSEASGCSDALCTISACRCKSPSCAGGSCTKVFDAENPVSPSVMSYSKLAGSATMKSALAPIIPITTTLCAPSIGYSRRWHSYSKGLNPSLNESSLIEKLPRTAETMRLIQHLRSTGTMTEADSSDCSPNHPCRNLYGVSDSAVPYCDVEHCYVDWNEDRVVSTSPVSYDLSRGDWDGDGDCDNDLLGDINEWGRIMSLGRQLLRTTFIPDEYHVLKVSFAGGVAANLASDSLSEQPSVVGQLATGVAATYWRNMCTASSECRANSAACRKDFCASTSQCRQGATGCTAGVCACTSDQHCFSGLCSSGKCATDFGICTGTVGSPQQCFSIPVPAGESDTTDGLGMCETHRTGAATLPWIDKSEWKPYHSLALPGPGSAAYLSLDAGAHTHGSLLSQSGKVSVRVDFYWDGFTTATDGIQVLFESEFGRIQLEQSQLLGWSKRHARLRLSADGNLMVNLKVPSTVRANRWHRLTWVIDTQSGIQWAELRQWNMSTGVMNSATSECWQLGLPSFFAMGTPSELRFGGSPSTAATFKGRLDNLMVDRGSFVKPDVCPTVN